MRVRWTRYRWSCAGLVVASRLAVASDAAPARPASPTLQAEAIGPTMIRLTVTAPPQAHVVVTERKSEGRSPEESRIVTRERSSPVSQVVRALPDTTYVYRARAEEDGSAWSGPVSVRTLPAPTSAPRSPTDLTATAVSPFAVELRWKDESDDEYGFALERRDGDDFVRVALLDPGTTRFVHHGRAPDGDVVYRVRAFNAVGVSAASNRATVHTPKVSDAPAVLEDEWTRSQAALGIAPCRTAATARDEIDEGRPPLEKRIEYGEGHALDLFAAPDSCGNANCNWIAYGTYDGCYRELGLVGGVGSEVVTTTPSGLPVLITVGHGSATEYGAGVAQIVKGRLLDVDAWTACSIEGEDDLVKVSPPFEDCQRDGDLWAMQTSKRR